MPQRADLYFAQTSGLLQFSGGGTQYLVQTPSKVLYLVYADNANDVVYRKSTDNGLTWSASVAVFAGTVVAISVWYDRWSNISAGLIHVAYTETDTDDVRYRSIDTESSDTLSTETVIFAGTDTAAGGALSITRARGGNLGCYFNIDNGTEDGFSRSTDVGANWTAKTGGVGGDPSEGATQDQAILLPGWNAGDTQDLMMFFWDASANEISRKLYDDSADTWAETSIVAATDTAAATSFPHYAAAVDIANTRNVLISWNAVDLANADLLCFTVTESAITAKTDVITNSVDDQHLAAIGIDTATTYWWAFYCGKSDGSETVGTSVNIYCKVSQDSGTTWGPEVLMSTAGHPTKWLATIQRFVGNPVAAFHCDEAVGIRDLRVNVQIVQPRAGSLVGM